MRLTLAACALVLVAPATALADRPVISYVDETGVFRLYDTQSGAEVEPPPPVPAFATINGFRYGMSQDGRYIVYSDAAKQLHLLDRATNTLIPLPGIDVYGNPEIPDNLTVSANGLIAFDKQGNGPTVVYDSQSGQFADTGLLADNANRQPRLSGDGHFLGTTCDSLTKCPAPTANADAFVQDLVDKSDTAFPVDAATDEEHPCLSGDGSIFGIDMNASAADTTNDIFLFDRSQAPPAPIAISGANTAGKEDLYCVLDSTGRYLGFMNDFVTFRVWDRIEARFLDLPPDKEFDRYSVLSDAYTPPAGGGPPAPPPSGDRVKPVTSRVRMTHRRFRPRRRATAFRFVLSEPAAVRIVIRRVGRYAGQVRRARLSAGAHTIPWSGRLRGRKVRPGSYAAVVIATDLAGNLSLPVLREFRVLTF